MMTKEELLAEEYICNGKCQDDITRNYVHCKTCTRLNDFLAWLKAGSQLDRVWHDYDAGEDCYEDSYEGRWVEREADRPKWHKVADGDLPEYGVEVLDENGNKVRYEMEGYAGDSGQFPSLSGWIAYSEYEGRDVEIDAPVAWCEVPQYMEVEWKQ